MVEITLKAARVNAGYTQKKAAELLGISCMTLWSWEKGKTFPSMPMIEKICGLYGVSYNQVKFLPNTPLKVDSEVTAHADT